MQRSRVSESFIFLFFHSKTMSSLPKTHKIVRVISPVSSIRNIDPAELSRCITIEEQPLPVPRNGEVLIRVERSAINPMDLSTLKGNDNWCLLTVDDE
jgi:hypothetical protein